MVLGCHYVKYNNFRGNSKTGQQQINCGLYFPYSLGDSP